MFLINTSILGFHFKFSIILLSFSETAINIGYSCQLLTDDLVDVFIVDATTFDEVQQQLIKFKENIKIVHTFQPRSPIVPNIKQASNGKMESSNHSTGTSTPPLQPSHPPAVSVVTFRWDDDIQKCDNLRAR